MIFEMLKEKNFSNIMKSPGENVFKPFPLYEDRAAWNSLPEEAKEHFEKAAQKLKDKTYAILPATVYMNFTRNGNRHSYENIYFPRRADLMTLVAAECISGKKEYIDDIINLVWAICEETSWVPSAHNNKGELPDIEHETYIDLFASETASAMAWTYYFLGEAIAEASPTVKRRIEIEVERRILIPYMKYNHFWYMGLEGNAQVNNWNPWINSNIIVAFAVFSKDRDLLIKGIEKTAKSSDSFINVYSEDGACDEGPGYFGAAGAALFDYLEVLSDITGGKVSIYENELIKNMARYIYRVYIGESYYVNFADGSCRPGAPAKLMARTGELIGDENLISFANYILSANPGNNYGVGYSHIYRAFKSLFQKEYMAKPFEFPKVHWFKDTEILTARDTSAKEGMFIAAKGGHNAESHNHNDVGSFIVYFDGKPVIVDVGVETYTKKTFSSERYDIWTMQSCYHSLPTVNGFNQVNGGKYRSSDVKYDHSEYASGDVTELSMQLKNAYPQDSGIESYIRDIKFEHGKELSVHDSYKLSRCDAPFVFNAVCVNKPEITEQGKIKLSESVEMAFDGVAFDVSVEEIKLTDSRIKNDWRQDYLYRLRLSDKEIKKDGDMTVRIYKSR